MSSSSNIEGDRQPENRMEGHPTLELGIQVQAEKSSGLSDNKNSRYGTGRSVAIIVTALCAQLMVQAQIGGSLNTAPEMGRALGTDVPGEWAWIPASYALTSGIFVLFFGRLADIFGPKTLFIVGFVGVTCFNLVTGFMNTPISHDVLRGIVGFWAAATYVSSVSVLGRSFHAGSRWRVVGFCLYGAMAPVGAYIGAMAWGLILQETDHRWPYWSMACWCAVISVAAYFVIPYEAPAGGSMDWLGAVLGISSMILFNFVWNQAPMVGWNTVYIYVLLIVSLILFMAFAWWQRRMGDKAMLPARMFRRKEVAIVLGASSFGWMSFGIFIFYTVQFLKDFRGCTPVTAAVHLTPLAPMGAFAALLLIYLEPRVKAHWIFAAAMLAFCAGNILVGLTPVDLTYWAMIFPAAMILPFGPDLCFASSQLLLSNSVPREDQGSAGGISLTIVNYCISLGLGFAGTVERYVSKGGADHLKGTRAALWFGACLAFIAFLLVALFVRVERPDITEDIKEVERD